MKKLTSLSVLLVSALFPSAAAAQHATFNDESGQSSSEQEFVVDFQDSASETSIREVSQRYGINLQANSPQMVNSDRIYLFRAEANAGNSIISRIRNESNVQGAEQNHVMRMFWTPNDPRFSEQWGLRRIGVEQAWNQTCGRNVRVAVVDTGVACETHGNFQRLSDLNTTNCVEGWNFVNDTNRASDDQGHGSHVAGTIAQATNNGVGFAGIAHCSTIIPVKVLDSRGSGTLADVAEGIRFAADNGANVINLSLGGGPRNPIMAEAVAYARARGSVVICAAGNNGHRVESPANEPGSFAVSAIGPGDVIAEFSSRGTEIAIAAPGVNIPQQTICDRGRNGCEQFVAWSGTSMAAPHVAGVAALIVSMGVTDPSAVESILRSSAEVPEHRDRSPELYGAGVVSAKNAVSKIEMKKSLWRGFSFMLMTALIMAAIAKKGGKVEDQKRWLFPAMYATFGLSILTMWLPFSLPKILTVPPGELTFFTNTFIHQFLPLGSAFLPLVLIGTFYSNKALRAPIGGFTLGTSAFLLGTFLSGLHAFPFGWFPMLVWTLGNVFVMSVIARLTLDSTKNQK